MTFGQELSLFGLIVPIAGMLWILVFKKRYSVTNKLPKAKRVRATFAGVAEVARIRQVVLVILATVATFIASQAVISGAFSITHQAMQLGFMPRLSIRHTSETEVGQIYIPVVNWALMVDSSTVNQT